MRAPGLKSNSRASSLQGQPASFPEPKDVSHQTSRWVKGLLAAFLLLAFICVTAQVVLFADLDGAISAATGLQNTTGADVRPTSPSPSSAVPVSVCTRLAILIAVTIGCFGVIIYLFVKKVVIPISGVTRAISEIAKGNLAVTVPSAIRHDVGDLGQVVNDVAANFQEVLLLTGTTVGNASASLERIDELLRSEANPDSKSRIQEHVNSVKRDVDSLGSVLKSFKFYQTAFNGREVKHAHPDERSE